MSFNPFLFGTITPASLTPPPPSLFNGNNFSSSSSFSSAGSPHPSQLVKQPIFDVNTGMPSFASDPMYNIDALFYSPPFDPTNLDESPLDNYYTSPNPQSNLNRSFSDENFELEVSKQPSDPTQEVLRTPVKQHNKNTTILPLVVNTNNNNTEEQQHHHHFLGNNGVVLNTPREKIPKLPPSSQHIGVHKPSSIPFSRQYQRKRKGDNTTTTTTIEIFLSPKTKPTTIDNTSNENEESKKEKNKNKEEGIDDNGDEKDELFNEEDEGEDVSTNNNSEEDEMYSNQRKGGGYNVRYGGGRKVSTTRLPPRSVEILKNWLLDRVNQPYPSKEEKEILAQKTGLEVIQVNNWFINARRRVIRPMLAAKGETTTDTHYTRKLR